MDSMFSDCINLEYINVFNFNESQIPSYENIFSNVQGNIVICANENTTKYIIFEEIYDIKCHVIDCSNDWEIKQKKIINNTNECIDSCDNSTQYKYEYNGKCYENCSNGFLYDNYSNIINKCKCELDKCLICPNFALYKNLCKKCNINYYPKENDPTNIGEYINCYKQPEEGYYLDNSFGLFRKCYQTCKTCNISGNNLSHNCLECNDNFSYRIENNNYFNCYENCSYYYYFDKENNFHCTLNSSCPEEYPKLIENNNECIKYDIEDKIKILKRNDTDNSNEEIEYYDNIIEVIENEFTSENYDTANIDNGQDEIIKTDKITTTLTTSDNQRNNKNNNMTRIDLCECESLLRHVYNLTNNETLYIKKLDIIQEGIKTLKVEYNVYAKLFGKNLIKLNLTVCEKSKISISIPIIINEPLDKLNSSSGYYNDICYTTTSEDGTDILLKDRQKEYIDKDRIICQEDCDFSKYDYETLVATCSCEVKECSESFEEMNINKSKLLENFKNIKNFLNFNFLARHKNLFNKNGFINNIGCYLILIIIIFHIIIILVFSLKQYSLLINKIIIIASVKEYENNKMLQKTRLKTTKKSLSQNNNKMNIKKKRISYINTLKTLNNIQKKIKPNCKINIQDKNIKEYIDEEINGFSYIMAKRYDKRNYFQYYSSLIKTQHNLICALFNSNDYNIGVIKIDLFLIGFTIEYTVNALFYNDDTMHKIYESKGDFDLETQIPIVFYSTIISMILNYPLNYLALSKDVIITFKQDIIKIEIMKKVKILKNAIFHFQFKMKIYSIKKGSFYLLHFYKIYINIFNILIY